MRNFLLEKSLIFFMSVYFIFHSRKYYKQYRDQRNKWHLFCMVFFLISGICGLIALLIGNIIN